MLLLTSTNDRLQVITSSTATIDVHASWVDTSAGTITPGRTNTAIASATTTSVAGAPAASTQRNVKTLHVRNKHASLSCDITIQHTDGTIISQLYKATLTAGTMLEYTDQGGFGGGTVTAPIASAPTRQTLTSGAGVYTTPVGASYIEVELVGGGGGGGHANTTGTPGGNTTFSTITGAGGTGGGAAGNASAGLGGTATGGDINIPGSPGRPGSDSTTTLGGIGGGGGDSFYGGSGRGLLAGQGSAGAVNSGSGGSGGSTDATGGVAGGQGGGAGGYCRKLIVSPSPTYSYAVGVGGIGAVVSGNFFAAADGGSGIIVVTEYYR